MVSAYCFDNELIAQSVETVLAELILLCNLLVNGVRAYVGWYCGVEGRVEVGDIGCKGERFCGSVYYGEGWGVVSGYVRIDRREEDWIHP